MALPLELNREAARPLYQQIAAQIKSQISNGDLPAGTRLPTVRQLADSLAITRMTAYNAYAELQSGGWVEATVGRGTYVAEGVRPQALIATIGRRVTPDGVMDDLIKIEQTVGLRSMAYAQPDPACFPMEAFWNSLEALRGDSKSLMQYGVTQGGPQLRAEIVLLLEEQGITALPGDVMVTSGMTQAMNMATHALAQPGDTVLVEQPTFVNFLNLLKTSGVTPVGVPMDLEGPRLDVLEELIIRHQPRFFFTIPNFHNPTGRSMSMQRRYDLLELAGRYGLYIFEDDVYGRLSYDGPPPTNLKAIDRNDLVIYASSFAKTIMPGLRIGYLLPPSHVFQRLMTLRRTSDLFGSMLIQRAVASMLHRKHFKRHLRQIIPVYRERRDALLQALARWMPDEVRWTAPEGGFSCWLTLPNHPCLSNLHQLALHRGLAFTPGAVFLAEPSQHQHLRLCFGEQPPEVIEEGVALLAELIHACRNGTMRVGTGSLSSAALV